jgi:CRP-like cAMP-binding protein
MEKLSGTYFFRDLDAAEMETLSSITRVVEARKGELILRQGQPSENLFIVRTGSVRVIVSAADQEEIPSSPDQTLVVLGPGECFGEFAFVDRKNSSATVAANEDSTLYALSHRDLDERLLVRPSTAAKIYKALLGILVSRFRNTDLELAMRKAIGG